MEAVIRGVVAIRPESESFSANYSRLVKRKLKIRFCAVVKLCEIGSLCYRISLGHAPREIGGHGNGRPQLLSSLHQLLSLGKEACERASIG